MPQHGGLVALGASTGGAPLFLPLCRLEYRWLLESVTYRKSIRPMNDAERAEIEARINLKPPEKPTGLWRRLQGRVSGESDFLNRIYECFWHHWHLNELRGD